MSRSVRIETCSFVLRVLRATASDYPHWDIDDPFLALLPTRARSVTTRSTLVVFNLGGRFLALDNRSPQRNATAACTMAAHGADEIGRFGTLPEI